MNANPILLQKKYSRVIECFADKMNISLNAALDFFYRSEVYCLMRDGVSDMHCMSDAYLAEELKQEYAELGCSDRQYDSMCVNKPVLFTKKAVDNTGLSL